MELPLTRRQELNKNMREYFFDLPVQEQTRLRKVIEAAVDQKAVQDSAVETFDITEGLLHVKGLRPWLPEGRESVDEFWYTDAGVALTKSINRLAGKKPFTGRARKAVERMGRAMRRRGSDPFIAVRNAVSRLANYVSLNLSKNTAAGFVQRLERLADLAEACNENVTLSNFFRHSLPPFPRAFLWQAWMSHWTAPFGSRVRAAILLWPCKRAKRSNAFRRTSTSGAGLHRAPCCASSGSHHPASRLPRVLAAVN